ncbi:hypothetical protein MRX96_029672 [Rhipicephalus microplus]
MPGVYRDCLEAKNDASDLDGAAGCLPRSRGGQPPLQYAKKSDLAPLNTRRAAEATLIRSDPIAPVLTPGPAAG